MSGSTVRLVIALILLVHTVGHIQGVLVSARILGTERWNARSWLVDRMLGERTSSKLALILWIVVTLGLLATVLSLLGIVIPHEAWRTLAIVFASLLTVSLVLYWSSFALFFPNKLGALAVNLATLAGLLWVHWPSEADLGF